MPLPMPLEPSNSMLKDLDLYEVPYLELPLSLMDQQGKLGKLQWVLILRGINL